jgi:hypothetical protein
MHERATTGIGWLIASGGIFEAFDDGSLPTAIVSDNDGHRSEELNYRDLFVVERSDAPNGKLVQTRHETGHALSGKE